MQIRMSSLPNTPKSNIITPLRLTKRQYLQTPTETPDCYTKVSVETPAPSKTRRTNKIKCDEASNLTVAVRVRPMNVRELSYVGASNIVHVEDNKITLNSNLIGTSITKLNHTFPYDYVFWSCDETNLNYASQEDVFLNIGKPLLVNAFLGYNACLFAYGQTGSGKSYSMMGGNIGNLDCSSAGIIPRFCKELFQRASQIISPNTITINISYFEIYNEKIHDLLMNCSNNQRTALKVREHPVWGPYVVNLSTHSVKSYEEIRSWLLLGNKNRATAATMMNEKSSRSHSIFSIELSLSEGVGDDSSSRQSKVSLIDLAGSERLGYTNKNDEKLKQGVCINKSLMTLGKVICALADQRKGTQFVPYRESVLTWLLRESLGGNSLTSMLATITPSNTHAEETLATLRYACQARSIINRAHINEDPHDRLIRELRLEVQRLQTLRQEYEKNSFSSSIEIDNSSEYLQKVEELRCKLFEKEDELKQAQQKWEDRYKETEQHQLQQLAVIEQRKDELESRIRVMSNINDEISLLPYKSNFLEEVENILQNPITEELLHDFKMQLDNSGFDYQVSVNECDMFLNIFDGKNGRKSRCSLNQIKSIMKNDNFEHSIRSLKWESMEVTLTENFINSTMNEIYNAAKLLQVHIDKEERLRLVFAKFIKSAQALEATLLNDVNARKLKKTVTFRVP